MHNINYIIYAETIEVGHTEKGGRLVWHKGCNGKNHVDCLDEIFFDDVGEVDYAKELAKVERGDCDRSCKAGGGFIYSRQPLRPDTTDYHARVELACSP